MTSPGWFWWSSHMKNMAIFRVKKSRRSLDYEHWTWTHQYWDVKCIVTQKWWKLCLHMPASHDSGNWFLGLFVSEACYASTFYNIQLRQSMEIHHLQAPKSNQIKTHIEKIKKLHIKLSHLSWGNPHSFPNKSPTKHSKRAPHAMPKSEISHRQWRRPDFLAEGPSWEAMSCD